MDTESISGACGEPPQDGADAPPPQPEGLVKLFNEVFTRAHKASGFTAAPEKSLYPMFAAYPIMQVSTKDTYLPAFPPVDSLYKRSEAKPRLDIKTELKNQYKIKLLSPEVAGLCYKEWKMPKPEKDMLVQGTYTRAKRNNDDDRPTNAVHNFLDRYAKEGWYANSRNACLLSCAGMLVHYLTRLCDSKGSDGHFEALAAAGIDADLFESVLANEAGMRFFFEIGRVTEVLANLIFASATELGMSTAVHNMCRRRVWLDTMGFKEEGEHLEKWLYNPSPSNGGLIGATSAQIETYKVEQSKREVLLKEMAPALKKPPAPVTTVTTTKVDSYTHASASIRNAYKARGRGNRGRGRPNNNRGRGKPTGNAAEATSQADTSTSKPNTPATKK